MIVLHQAVRWIYGGNRFGSGRPSMTLLQLASAEKGECATGRASTLATPTPTRSAITVGFVGQFVPPEFGLRRQTAVELKWGVHPDGDKRRTPWANGNGTTISVLVH